MFELSQAYAGKFFVSHYGWPRAESLMLTMALLTTGHRGMKGRRLTLQETRIVRMANDTTRRRDTLNGSMTGSAIMFKKGMSLRERPWTGHALPGHCVQNARFDSAGMNF